MIKNMMIVVCVAMAGIPVETVPAESAGASSGRVLRRNRQAEKIAESLEPLGSMRTEFNRLIRQRPINGERIEKFIIAHDVAAQYPQADIMRVRSKWAKINYEERQKRRKERDEAQCRRALQMQQYEAQQQKQLATAPRVTRTLKRIA